MEDYYLIELKRNDEEYKIGLMEEPNNLNNIIDNPTNIYNPSSFQSDIIIKYLQNKRLLNNKQFCHICNELMNLINNKQSCDNLIWRCHKLNQKHDSKINIRSGSIFEGFLIKIPLLYFLLFFCICENLTINEAFDKCNDFCQQIGENGIAKESISKFYRVVRNRIKERMHNNWKKNFLRIEINTKLGYGSVEIEESKTISSSNEIYWMYGIVDHNTKEARVFCVLKN